MGHLKVKDISISNKQNNKGGNNTNSQQKPDEFKSEPPKLKHKSVVLISGI